MKKKKVKIPSHLSKELSDLLEHTLERVKNIKLKIWFESVCLSIRIVRVDILSSKLNIIPSIREEIQVLNLKREVKNS